MDSYGILVPFIGVIVAIVIGVYIVSNVFLVALPEQPLFMVLAVVAVILSGTLVILGLILRRQPML